MELGLWRYPAAVLVGFTVQWFYLPSHSHSPLEGIGMICCLCGGSCLAYWWGWR